MIRSTFAAAMAATLLCGPAVADTSSHPELVRHAIEAGGYEAPETAVWRFTLDADYGDRGAFRARDDGSRPEGERWTLLSPAEDALSESLRETWVRMSGPREPAADDGESGEERRGPVGFTRSGGLFQNEDVTRMIAAVGAEVSSSPANVVYAFTPRMDGENAGDDFSRHLSGELTVTRNGPNLSRMRIFSTQSFKPHPAARIHAFEMTMEYAAEAGFPAPVLSRLLMDIDVSAMFQRRRQVVDMRFSDVQFVVP